MQELSERDDDDRRNGVGESPAETPRVSRGSPCQRSLPTLWSATYPPSGDVGAP